MRLHEIIGRPGGNRSTRTKDTDEPGQHNTSKFAQFNNRNPRKRPERNRDAVNRPLDVLEKQFVDAIYPGWENLKDTNGNAYRPYKILNMARKRAEHAGILTKEDCPNCHGLHPVSKETPGAGCPVCHNTLKIYPSISAKDVIRAQKLKNINWDDIDQQSKDEGEVWRDHKNSMQRRKYVFAKKENNQNDPRGPWWSDDGEGRINFPDSERWSSNVRGMSFHPAKILHSKCNYSWFDQSGNIHPMGESWEKIFGKVSPEEKNKKFSWKLKKTDE